MAAETRATRFCPVIEGELRTVGDEFIAILRADGNDAAHGATITQMTDEFAGIDFGDDGNAALGEETVRPLSSERQLLTTGEISRTTKPSM